MSVTEVALRWFHTVWAPGGDAAVDALMAADSTGWLEGTVVRGPQEFKDVRQQLFDTFPDLVLSVEDMVTEGDKVAVRWLVEATHTGHGLGIPPTNRHVSFRGITWLEVRDGRIVRGWDSWNVGGLVQSLKDPSPTVRPTVS